MFCLHCEMSVDGKGDVTHAPDCPVLALVNLVSAIDAAAADKHGYSPTVAEALKAARAALPQAVLA